MLAWRTRPSLEPWHEFLSVFTLSAVTYSWLSRVLCLLAVVVRIIFITLRAAFIHPKFGERPLLWTHLINDSQTCQRVPTKNESLLKNASVKCFRKIAFSDLGVKPLQSCHELWGPLTGHKVVMLLYCHHHDFYSSSDTGCVVFYHEPLTNHDFWVSKKIKLNKIIFFFFWKGEIPFKSREFCL